MTINASPSAAQRSCHAALVASPADIDAMQRLGVAIRGEGRSAEAEPLLRRALQVRPDNYGGLVNLGTLLQDLGAVPAAERSYRQAIVLAPELVEGYFNLGSVKDAAQPDQAAALFARAVTLRPDLAEARIYHAISLGRSGHSEAARGHLVVAARISPYLPQIYFNFANILRDAGRQEEAARAYRAALAVSPAYADASFNLGNLLRRSDDLQGAERTYRAAVEADPRRADARINRGSVLRELNQAEKSFHVCQEAVRLAPSLPEAHANLGLALRALGRTEQATLSFKRTLILDPGEADSYSSLGGSQQDQGRFPEAERCYERALLLEPGRGAFYRHLAGVRRFEPNDEALAAMEALIADQGIEEDDRIELHFALGSAYEQLRLYPRAFENYRSGNALKRRRITYDGAAIDRLFARIAETFNQDLLRSKAGLGDPSEVPIFIVGMPRSGTTLVEQILASHPKVIGAGESELFGRLAVALGGRGRDYIQAAAELDGAGLRQLGGDYVRLLREEVPDAIHITDKMPGNFQFVGLIHLAIPNAKIIHCRRDPIDTCLSCYSKLFSTGQPFSYDLGELGRYYRAYETLMEHWRRVLPEGVMIEVAYEKVVADLESQARRLLDHCGLAWDSACLSFHNTERTVQTASSTQVRKPLYKSSVERWKRYSDDLLPLIEALQAPKDGAMDRMVIDGREYLGDQLPEQARQLLPLLRFADLEIARLEASQSMVRKARAVLAANVRNSLPSAHDRETKPGPEA